MPTITTLNLHFNMQSEPFAHNLYGRWDGFFANSVERATDEVLGKLTINNEQLTIEKLDLDLGSVSEDDFDEQFPIRFREKLEEALIKCLHNPETHQNAKRISKKENAFQLLCEFLLHGALPWNAQAEHNNIRNLFLSVLQESPKELKQFLQTCGHYSSLQQRLVYQLGDPELEKGVYLLAPEVGYFIIGYVHFLRAKYSETEQPQTTESNFRDAVWLVIYSYLLTQRSSYFDKKNFLTATIFRLAAKYSLSYDSLLNLLTRELETFCKKITIPPELFQLLASLQKELSEKRLNESFVDAAKFYKTLYQSIKGELDNQLSESIREGLLRILANPHTCLIFLQHLTEPEIIRLLPIVIAGESDFVIKFAKVIDKAEIIDNGQLTIDNENKAKNNSQFAPESSSGLNSQLIKWQLIFPILLEKRGTRFNRKQFVRSVLHQIAAHCNLHFRTLMESFLRQSALLTKTDNELKSIFGELRSEELHFNGAQITQMLADNIRNLRESVSSASPACFQTAQLRQLLSDAGSRKKIIDQTREPERRLLIQQLYPKEHEFIISYLKSLDTLHDYSSLEAKAAGGFADVKWMFLFTVLSEMPDDNFNRKRFVGRVLQQIAAHYNLTYFDLLHFFHQEKTLVKLPFRLEQLLDELYREEEEQWLDMALKNGQETAKYHYIACFRGIDALFVKQLLQTLDRCHDKSPVQLYGKTSGRLNELKWRFVFEVLLETKTKAFNKKQFVEHTLRRMAAHYNLSFREIIAYFAAQPDIYDSSEFAEIGQILQAIYAETREGAKSANAQIHESAKGTNTRRECSNTQSNESAKAKHVHRHCEPAKQSRTDTKSQTNETNDIISNNIERHHSQFSPESSSGLNSQFVYNPFAPSRLRAFAPDNPFAPSRFRPFVQNAGTALISPYLPRLFGRLELTEKGQFKSTDAQIRAIFLIQYAVFGSAMSDSETTAMEYPENELTLNKLLTGFPANTPIPCRIDLKRDETETVDSMLQGVLNNWDNLKNSSLSALREGFLQREGKLEEHENSFQLIIEEKSCDLLLDTCPWNFRTIKFPWTDKVIHVKWR